MLVPSKAFAADARPVIRRPVRVASSTRTGVLHRPSTMLPYSSEAVESLVGLARAHQSVQATLASLRPALGAIIIAHGLEETVGVQTLHRHFPVAPDERLVAVDGGEAAYSITAPMRAATAPRAAPTVFRLHGDVSMLPLEFSAKNEDYYASAALSVLGAPGFVEEFSACVRAFGCIDVVGMALHVPPGALGDDEWMVESSKQESGRRESVLVAEKRPADGSPPDDDKVAVLWFAGGPTKMSCYRGCCPQC